MSTAGPLSGRVALVTDSGAWIRGQVIDAEGGFDRIRRP